MNWRGADFVEIFRPKPGRSSPRGFPSWIAPWCHNWVKVGYVPARWAGEGRAPHPGPHQRSRSHQRSEREEPGAREVAPRRRALRHSPGDRCMNQYAPAKRIYSFHPPAEDADGTGPTESIRACSPR